MQVSSPVRPVSARQYLRQPSDCTSNAWTAAAENLGAVSNKLPIDPLRDLRDARCHNSIQESQRSTNRCPHTARNRRGREDRAVKGGLDFNFARTPSAAAAALKGAEIATGGKTSRVSTKAGSATIPKYAQYYSSMVRLS
jgi:hypothetical protein